jgi:hypothetical protein
MHHRALLLLLLVVITIQVRSQDISELERRNGFKNIKLGMRIDSLTGAHYKKDSKVNDEFVVKLYTVEDEQYSKIGEVAIDKIEIVAYKDLIYEITVVTPKDSRVMKALESIYGLAEYDMKRETYFWKGADIVLKFRSHSKNKLEMVYTAPRVLALMKEDKGKKVQDIADDF